MRQSPPTRVLVVDDELIQRKVVSQQIQGLGFICESAGTNAECLQILRKTDFDVVLLDVQMDSVSGLEILPTIKKMEDAPEVIMLTLDNSLESGISAMRDGAYDYLIKPASTSELEVIINKAAEKRNLIRHSSSLNDFVKTKIESNETVSAPIYQNPVMQRVFNQAKSVAQLSSTILITGESGTGKDVLARFIHQNSLKSKANIISVNCGAMPENLFESEFFGYEKGAFTGAATTKRGLLEAAVGSTLFLDEIGEMPINLQVKLLRFLESGEFRRVGATRDLFANTRIIAATNQNLAQAIDENRFRSDLFYRLNVIEFHIPPLRERREDLNALIDYYLDSYRTQFNRDNLILSNQAQQKLIEYNYPGNIRELKNIIERAVALSFGEIIEDTDIIFQSAPVIIRSNIPNEKQNEIFSILNSSGNIESEKIIPLAEIERKYIFSVLKYAKGNREFAAELLGISERTLYRRIQEYQ